MKIKQNRLFIMREESDIEQHIAVKAGKELIWDSRFSILSDKDGYISTINKHQYFTVLKPLLQDKAPISPEIIATLPVFFDEDGNIRCVYNIYGRDEGVDIKLLL